MQLPFWVMLVFRWGNSPNPRLGGMKKPENQLALLNMGDTVLKLFLNGTTKHGVKFCKFWPNDFSSYEMLGSHGTGTKIMMEWCHLSLLGHFKWVVLTCHAANDDVRHSCFLNLGGVPQVIEQTMALRLLCMGFFVLPMMIFMCRPAELKAVTYSSATGQKPNKAW